MNLDGFGQNKTAGFCEQGNKYYDILRAGNLLSSWATLSFARNNIHRETGAELFYLIRNHICLKSVPKLLVSA
jgi:hypothetical protein